MLSLFRLAMVFVIISGTNVYADKALRFAGWGGSYAQIYAEKVLRPFHRHSGIHVQQFDAAGRTSGDADVVELGLHDAVNGCDQGDLMYLPAELLSNMSASIEDFLPNALQPCAVGQLVWSTVVAFNPVPENSAPQRMDDFFNTEAFPGGRAIRKSPRALVEWALAAGGIPPDRIYEVLSDTDTAWRFIEKQLKRIEGHVVWVDSDEQAFQSLKSNAASFAVVSSTSLMKEVVAGGKPGVIWDSALYEMSMLAIPVTTENSELSLEFVRHVVENSNITAVSAELGLGTARYSSADLLNTAYSDFLPGNRISQTTSLWLNAQWWGQSASEIIVKFLDWSDQVDTLQSLAMASPDNLTFNLK